MSLQTRLMTAVIGFVSLILIIVAVITSATLGSTLERQLDEKVESYAAGITKQLVQQVPAERATVDNILKGGNPQIPGLLFAVASPVTGATGIAFDNSNGDLGGTSQALTADQLHELISALGSGTPATVSLAGLGSYRVVANPASTGVVVVTGLPRDEIQNQLTQLLTVIALATIGGLILLALTTAITIRVSLRPLRAVALTATRVANQQLDRGEVTITERVPASEADPRTETGIVGASLNKLLDHVNTSLASRQKNEERMRRFVADASHELRTPLASIRGYSELSLRALRQSNAQAERPEVIEGTTSSLERIQAQSLRMTRLVEDLLLLARLDEGQELVYGTVDLTQLALEGLSDARPTAADHHWNIDVPDEPVTIVGDAGRMHQVVANLLANARTHTPAGTTVTLSVAQEGEDAVLRVHDDGPGIDPAIRDELFARFARGDSSRARQTGGTGLGLAIAKAIVEGHHGFITVTSEPGDTTFTVRIPRNPAAADDDTAEA
ncbi:ATP-binding protein [Microbacterium sp.]|uniref:sensor histidine kinase n=1 Tax=Microbacterium sp. TaxID=51671 RepID=UPI0026047D53|nr:ATP-binding protein [Microbacterium sp.]MCV0335570.1 two-component sensor histidine kinase [Microbacterium sp.]MCV0376828.1 two-component sensor histidine kinase [Microbacterium sp.]MCV0390588.1 two-component sensor histidine kinase [Microbacterium sp.]MCV0418323.1 two-component sensor histidine kinase [Microbacterium sp.]MCV0422009.1 two-component sensor histidine kinase [Microbacterium sp.]